MAQSIMFRTFLSLVLCFSVAWSLVIDNDLRPFYDENNSDKLDTMRLLIDRGFGFLKGGVLSVEIVPTGPPVQLNFVMCNEKQYWDLVIDPGPCKNESGTRKIDTTGCTINAPFGVDPDDNNRTSNYTLVDYQVEEMGQYYLLLVKCPYVNTSVPVHVKMTLLNPSQQHLTLGEIPLPSMYAVLMICWLIISAAWIYNWLSNRQQKSPLHRWVTIYPLAKAIFCAVEVYFYNTYAQTGVLTDGMRVALIMTSIISDMSFYTAMLLLASGWCVTRDELGVDKFYIAGLMVTFSVVRCLVYLVNALFELLAIVINIAVLTMIFRWVTRNRIELALFVQPVDQRSSLRRLPVTEKDQIFSHLRFILLGYLIADVLIIVTQILFLRDLDFVTYMLLELAEMLMFICTAYLFRLRPANAYNLLDDGSHSVPQAPQPSMVELSDQPPFSAPVGALESEQPLPSERRENQI